MKPINLIILFLSLNIITFGQKPKFSTKISNIMESNKNDLFESLQGEHQLRNDAGWITFENYTFKASVRWTRKDKMLGLGSGNPGQSRYSTSANIKGQYSIEEIKLNKNLDYKEKDKYGDVVGTISRGFLLGYKIYFSGKDQNGDNYNFCRIVYQPYNNGYIESWFVGDYFVNSNSRYECENATNEIDFNFLLTKYFKTSNIIPQKNSNSNKIVSNADNIIGMITIISNLEVAEFDFPTKLNWNDSKIACSKLGKGWRLPTIQELELIYNSNKKMKMNLKDGRSDDEYADEYWSSELNSFKNSARILMTQSEMKFSRFVTEKLNVRAVRSVNN